MTAFVDMADGHRIAYFHSEGDRDGVSPGVVFLGGFKSDMHGTKARMLEEFCAKQNRQFTRFDYFGHGQSSGEFRYGTIGRWHQDSLHILDNITRGPQILVGSSMGGWLMLLCALARPQRVYGLVGIASACDFTERLIWQKMDPQQRQNLVDSGFIEQPSDYQPDPYVITWSLIQEARQHLLLGNRIDIDVPTCLIHGQRDRDVPWQTSMEIADQIHGDEVSILLIKNGDHRLSSPEQLQIIRDQLQYLIDKNGPRP